MNKIKSLFSKSSSTKLKDEEGDTLVYSKVYSAVGISMMIVVLVGELIGRIINFKLEAQSSEVSLIGVTSDIFIGYIAIYFIGILSVLLVLKKIPMHQMSKQKISKRECFQFLMICFPLNLAGGILGNLFSTLISGGTSENPIVDAFSNINLFTIIIVCILGPIFEEFVFRKLIIDHTWIYGEKSSVILSALIFALMHVNLYQLFYAFFGGLVLGYVYVKTGYLRYSIAIHMGLNITTCILTYFSNSDFTAGSTSLELGFLLEVGFALFMIVSFFAGIFLLLNKKENINFTKREQELPREQRCKIIYRNVGMILYIAVTGILTITNLYF